MKTVIRQYGTDTKQLLNAVSIVTDTENETQEFKAKLLQYTMRTEEYQMFFEAGQSKLQTRKYKVRDNAT